MNTNTESTAVTAGIHIVDSLMDLRSAITDRSSSSALLNHKAPYDWTAEEWYNFFFKPITAQEAAVQVADAYLPIAGQHNTQMLKAGAAIAAAYQQIHSGANISPAEKLTMAKNIVTPIVMIGVAPVALLTSTITRAGANYVPVENVVGFAQTTNTRVRNTLNNANLSALNPHRLFENIRSWWKGENDLVEVDLHSAPSDLHENTGGMF
jgi:hypothetical protein